jgi:hypothetical protein
VIVVVLVVVVVVVVVMVVHVVVHPGGERDPQEEPFGCQHAGRCLAPRLLVRVAQDAMTGGSQLFDRRSNRLG